MSKREIVPEDVCYTKITPGSADYHANGMFVTVKKKMMVPKDGDTLVPVWTFVPDIYSERLKKNFEFAEESILVPIAGPTVEDVKDTLEVLSLANNKTFDALKELSKKTVKQHEYEDQKK